MSTDPSDAPIEETTSGEGAPRMSRSPVTSLLKLVAASIAGLSLGVVISYFDGAPLTNEQGGYVFIAIIAVVIWGALLLALVVRAVSRRSPVNGLMAAGLVVAGATGLAIAPPGLGTWVVSPGSGSLGTRDNATALWSGQIECRWLQDWGSVQNIVGFDLPLTDPALISELELDVPNAVPTGLIRLRVVALMLPRKPEQPAHPGIAGDGTFMAGGEARPFDEFMPLGSEVTLESVSQNMQTGKAASKAGRLAFIWSCDKGP
jgi:hypothetical protein